MKQLRNITIGLLVFIGLNALAGGYLLMAEPSGSLLWLSIEQLDPAVFEDFLIPGIILFLVNGVMGMITALFVLFRWQHYAEMTMLQGVVLSVWIIVQIFFYDQTYYLHYAVLVTGLLLFVLGIRMRQLIARQG